MGTSETTELAARAYNTLAWRHDRSQSELNFPKLRVALRRSSSRGIRRTGGRADSF
jgi:hypothetical protein